MLVIFTVLDHRWTQMTCRVFKLMLTALSQSDQVFSTDQNTFQKSTVNFESIYLSWILIFKKIKTNKGFILDG